MPAEIQSLITGQDAFEAVRDKIAAILVLESAQQQVLAAAVPLDPAPWALRVFVERSSPWEEWSVDPQSDAYDTTPMVNVSYDSTSYNERASNVVSKQSTAVTYNIDCYGQGVSRETVDGHDPGDESAAFECQRAVRLVRRILMSSYYTYLGMRGTVGKRFPTSIEAFDPPIDAQNGVKVQAARMKLVVDMVETSPQYEGETLEILNVEVRRSGTNEVLANVTAFDETPDP